MSYTKTTWANDTTPTINATNLNHIEAGIADAGGSASMTVAANDSPTKLKNRADYVCDGVADDVQIQAAIDELPSGGGKVFISEGHYITGASIHLRAKPLHICGAGKDVTYITLGDGVNDSIIKYTESVSETFLLMQDFTIDGNKDANTVASSGIEIAPTGGAHLWDAVFKNIFILRFKNRAFITNDAHDYIFDHCIFEYCDGQYALELVGGFNPVLQSCLIKLNGGRGIRSAAAQLSMSGCSVVDNGGCGMIVEGENDLIHGNIFYKNGSDAANTYEDVWLVSCAGESVIVGNTFLGTDHKNAIRIESDNNIITDNLIKGTTGTPIWNNGGTGNYVRNNHGYVTEASGTETIATAATSVDVTHGLAVTPTADDISVTPAGSLLAASSFWIDTIGASTFRINVNGAPGGAGVLFAWKAIVL